jgi:BASS family bile acid:Na+ symporter
VVLFKYGYVVFMMDFLKRCSQLLATFTSAIILAVAVVTFWQPGLFTWVKGDIQTVVLGVIMLTMGMTLKPQDFTFLVHRPLDVIIGAIAQYTLMPLIAFGLVYLFNFPKGIAVGLLLVGCSPGGVSSNLISFLSRGDLALSVGMTTVSTLLSPFLTPLLMLLLLGNRVDIQAAQMFKSILIVTLLPIAVGVGLNLLFGKSERYQRFCELMPGVSVLAFACIVGGVMSYHGRFFFDAGVFIFMAVFLHNALGYLTGYWAGILAQMPRAKRRTVAIEVGIQNAGLATHLATRHFALLPEAAIVAAVSCIWHSISGTLIATFFQAIDRRKRERISE